MKMKSKNDNLFLGLKGKEMEYNFTLIIRIKIIQNLYFLIISINKDDFAFINEKTSLDEKALVMFIK